MAATTPSPNYGFRTPEAASDMYQRAGFTVLFALVMWWNSRADYPGPSVQVALVLVLIAVALAVMGYFIGKFHAQNNLNIRDQMIQAAALKGDETVLVANAGLGLVANAVGKSLTNGKVIALGSVDTNDAARENAKVEGLAGKVRFESADLPKIPYANGHFDAVLATELFAPLDSTSQAAATAELLRILKPGGRLVVYEKGSIPTSIPQPTLTPLGPFGLAGMIAQSTKR
jgi:SAM-dependent methyltransferase